MKTLEVEVGMRHELNWSSIQTRLIREAVVCSHWASDIIITINSIQSVLDEGNFTEKEFLIGFRELGVDGTSYVNARLKSPEMYGNPYFKIFKLTATCDECDWVTLELSEEDLPKSSRNEIVEKVDRYIEISHEMYMRVFGVCGASENLCEEARKVLSETRDTIVAHVSNMEK